MDTAAQFVSAAIRTRRYAPPVDILAIDTATPEALQHFDSIGGYWDGHQPLFDRQGIKWTLIYCLIGLVCTVFLITLFGVLYSIIQRNNAEFKPGENYHNKPLQKMVSLLGNYIYFIAMGG